MPAALKPYAVRLTRGANPRPYLVYACTSAGEVPMFRAPGSAYARFYTVSGALNWLARLSPIEGPPDDMVDEITYARSWAMANEADDRADYCQDEGCPHYGTLHVCKTIDLPGDLPGYKRTPDTVLANGATVHSWERSDPYTPNTDGRTVHAKPELVDAHYDGPLPRYAAAKEHGQRHPGLVHKTRFAQLSEGIRADMLGRMKAL